MVIALGTNVLSAQVITLDTEAKKESMPGHQEVASIVEATSKMEGIPDPVDYGAKKTLIDVIDIWLLICFFLK